MRFKRKQKGIGLLELMLSLAIIAVLLVMATRYFLTASSSSRVNQTVDIATSVAVAAENWKLQNNNSYEKMSLTDCRDKGWIPASIVSDKDNIMTPWGKANAIVSTVNDVSISFDANDSKDAAGLASRICSGGSDGKPFPTPTGTSFKYSVVTHICS